jgi:hypothetical protein
MLYNFFYVKMVMIATKRTTLLATFAIVATVSLIAASGVAAPAFASNGSGHNHHGHDHNHNLRDFFNCVRDHGGKNISKNELNRCFNKYLD